MSCFGKLSKSGFFKNASSELTLAQQALKKLNQVTDIAQLYADKLTKKNVYNYYVDYYYLLDELTESIDSMEDSLIYYINVNEMMFVYSKSKKLINESVRYSYNVSGDIPLCQSKHKINNQYIFTVLFDTRINFTPYSPN